MELSYYKKEFIMKNNTNIVIIRQYGSGGREVSSILAKNSI